ncbi:hypothetical protein [Aquimarina algiphila]|uniref:hypothetical protein n=1 Tax=Aquimarina algiphila TaxID=2047982 RepID=UPI002330D579|nr:hypothetical protein [Aquimarina algiphila]
MERSTMVTSTNIKNKIIPIIKGVVAFLVVTLSLFHVFFSNTTPEIEKQKQVYKSLVKERDTFFEKNLVSFQEGKLSKDEYIELTSKAFIDYKSRLKEIVKTKNAYAIEFSFQGRSSFHFWIFVFGLVAALFFFSCKSLKDDFLRGSTFKFHFVSLSGILVSGFWFIHLIFLTQKDFNQNKYVWTLLACAVLFSVFTYFLVKHYTYKDDIIYKQLSFIMRVRTLYFPRLAIKAKFAENNNCTPEGYEDKSVSEDIDEFQEDLRATTANL